MSALSFPEFHAALPAKGALLGLDPGEKRIGVAVCDPGRLIATALEQITRKKFADDARRIFELYAARACVGIVIGLPLNMDGSAGPSAQAARAFARNLAQHTDVPLLLWDERLSTAAAHRAMLEADLSRKKRAENVDKLAAAFMLQGAIDRMQENAASS